MAQQLAFAPDNRTTRTRPPGVARQRILAVVRHNPGIHVGHVARLVGMAWNTVDHHIRRMERAGVVACVKVQGRIALFDATQGRVPNKRAQALLKDARNRVMLGCIVASPGSTQRGLADATGLAASVVHRRLASMEDAGLVYRTPDGRSNVVHPTRRAHDALVEAWQ